MLLYFLCVGPRVVLGLLHFHRNVYVLGLASYNHFRHALRTLQATCSFCTCHWTTQPIWLACPLNIINRILGCKVDSQIKVRPYLLSSPFSSRCSLVIVVVAVPYVLTLDIESAIATDTSDTIAAVVNIML